MRQRWNGSIQSSNVPTYDKAGISREDYGVYRCMVTNVLYIDDPQNISKNATNPEVLYEVVILGGWATGQTLSFCRLSSYLGGIDNHSERTLKATTKKLSKDKLEDHDGDIVYVQFNQGHDAYPIIIGLAKGLKDSSGAKKADGPRLLDLYNGFETNINNKGEYSRSMKSGETTDGVFKAKDEVLITELWAKDEGVTKTFKSGLSIKEDGKNDKVLVKTAGGVEATIDGKGNKVSIKAGATEVLIDGASGKISLKGEMVDLGSSVSDFVTMFTQLASAFASHTHMVPQAPSGTLPSMPPMAPLLSSVGSATVKVQS